MKAFFIIAFFVSPFLTPNLLALLIVHIILGIIVTGMYYDDYLDEHFFGKFFFWEVVGIIPFCIAYGILSSSYKEVEKPLVEPREVLERREEILSLGLEAGVEGHFSLGFGSIDNIPFYVAHKATPDGGVRVHYINGQSTLYEDIVPPKQPYYDTFKVQHRERRLNTPGWVLYVTKNKRTGQWVDGELINKIHVPPQTVKREFSSQ